MSTSKFTTLASSGAALLLSVAALNAQTTVYDNTKFDQGSTYTSGDEYGDQIALKLGPRTVQGFQFNYFSTYDMTAGASLKFYANDGALVNGMASPGTLLYDSGPIDIKSGIQTVSIGFSSIPFEVPNSFTWTAHFNGIDVASGKQSGLLVYDPPGPGASDATFWRRNGTTWSLDNLSGANGVMPANFNAKLITVPEPSTYALMALGLVGWVGLSAWRRNRN
jgi:hypothetical protein